MKVSKQLQAALEGIATEITAGSVLHPYCESDRAWNNANKRAVSIIERYHAGHGLFQQKTKKPRKSKVAQ